jgi:hypothetical protein
VLADSSEHIGLTGPRSLNFRKIAKFAPRERVTSKLQRVVYIAGEVLHDQGLKVTTALRLRSLDSMYFATPLRFGPVLLSQRTL